MEKWGISIELLATLFLIVAFLYSSVGLGGGSSYTALMALCGIDPLAIPTISLTLNLLVTSIGSFHFIRNRHARFELITPFLVSSIPMSYLGGSLKVPKQLFYWILLITLVFVALRIYLFRNTSLKITFGRKGCIAACLLIGSILGLVAGIVGIGGGIYLVPCIIIFGLGTEKEAAAAGAIFIWINSLSGLLARLQHHVIDLNRFLPLIVAVLIGGALGSFLGASRFSPRTLQKTLGIVILLAIVFLTRKVLVL